MLIQRVRKSHVKETIAEAGNSNQVRSHDSAANTGGQFDFKIHCLFCIDITPCVLPSEYPKKKPMQIENMFVRC